MRNHKFTISIATHNRLDCTTRCLESIAAHSNPGELDIIVFDNASNDGTVEYLRKQAPPELLPRIAVHLSDTNMGFGYAHNKNLEFATGDYFIVLNNDIEVGHQWLNGLHKEFLLDPSLGICGASSMCSVLGHDGIGRSGHPPDYVEGSCLMIPTWLAKREGLFDPDFRFAYCEDADLSLRLRKKGWHIKTARIGLSHIRGATVAAVRFEGRVDIEGYHKVNHQILQRKWGRYLEERAFSERIRIRRAGARGDVLMLTPIIHALKEQNAFAEIDVETECGAVLSGNPEISHYHPRLEQRGPYGRSIDLDLCYERSPKKHIIEAYAEACGLDPKAIDWRLRIQADRDSRKLARDLLGSIPTVAIHPGTTAWPGRNWAPDKFDRLAQWFISTGWHVALVGDTSSPTIPRTFDCRGHSLAYSLAVIERCKLFVGIDSLPMHLAQAALVPTVGIFGLIDPKYRLLPFPFITGVRDETLGCVGCHHELSPPRISGLCLRERELCMENISVEQVWNATVKVLKEKEMYLEASKIRPRIANYIAEGSGLDIGCGGDKIAPNCIGFDDDAGPDIDSVGDARALPWPQNTFDWVFSSHCLEDLVDTKDVLAEWLRVIVPGGKIILYVPHPDLYKGYNADHKHAGFRPEELSELLASLGCTIIEAFVDDGPDRYSTCVVAEKGLAA